MTIDTPLVPVVDAKKAQVPELNGLDPTISGPQRQGDVNTSCISPLLVNMDLANLTPEQLEELAKAMFSANKPSHFGPSLLGSVIDALLCGILLMQCGSYISSCAEDGWLLKATVGYVVGMNLWSTALAWASVWGTFVSGFGIYVSLSANPPSGQV
ncbi:hypothetical protein FS749_015101 [Ceratobasidium sp. UAMH 11750]|nr:hypothetical protein FS749_015101 [Ceratobasidium sp. UAMH 11750]